jgi:hypothetical protein
MHDSKSHLLYEQLMGMNSFKKIIGSVMYVVVGLRYLQLICMTSRVVLMHENEGNLIVYDLLIFIFKIKN